MAGELNIKIDDPFVISSMRQLPQYAHAFPHMWRMPDGRLFLSISKERDIHDMERFLLASDDGGRSFHQSNHLPLAKYPGASAGVVFDLGDGKMLSCLGCSFAATKRGVFELPTWFSNDAGRSWGSMKSSRMEIPSSVEPVDIYDPPQWWKQQHQGMLEHGFVKPKPPKPIERLIRKFSPRRGPGITSIVKVPPKGLLGLVSFAVERGQRNSVSAVRSTDRGRSWRFLSTVARYHDRYVDPSVVGTVDGFCEPALVKLPGGELLAVLRMGSGHPLYAVRSADNGKSWTRPKKLSIRGVLPQVVLMKNGALALLTGRPDVTLNLSTDHGRTWTYQVKLLEYASNLRSTSNTALLEAEPNKLLCVYDSFKTDRAGKDYWMRAHGHGKVLGCFVEINH